MYEILELARRLWAESEKTLNFLRTESGKPLKRLNDEEVMKWSKQLQKADCG